MRTISAVVLTAVMLSVSAVGAAPVPKSLLRHPLLGEWVIADGQSHGFGYERLIFDRSLVSFVGCEPEESKVCEYTLYDDYFITVDGDRNGWVTWAVTTDADGQLLTTTDSRHGGLFTFRRSETVRPTSR